MPPEVVVPVAAFALFFLGGLAFRRAQADDLDPEAEARRFIDRSIDANVERLARAYLQPGAPGTDDDLPPGFASEIESFIGNVLLWDALSAIDDEDVSAAVREIVVLDRQYVYDGITARVRRHVAQAEGAA